MKTRMAVGGGGVAGGNDPQQTSFKLTLFAAMRRQAHNSITSIMRRESALTAGSYGEVKPDRAVSVVLRSGRRIARPGYCCGRS